MTVLTTGTKTNYPMDGNTLAFPFTFTTLKETDIKASVTNDGVEYFDLTYTAGTPSSGWYTVNLNAGGLGGEVIVGNPQSSVTTLLIKRVVDLTQEDDLSNYGSLPAVVLERIADKITMISQQLQSNVEEGGGAIIPEPGEGDLPDGIEGQIIVKGEFDWEPEDVDNVTIEIDPTTGLRVKADSIGDDQLGSINGSGLVNGLSLTGFTDIPESAGLIPIENLLDAPIGGGEVVDSQAYNAAAPTVFTNLDLSSFVGAILSFVCLKITNNGGADGEYVFITNGEIDPHTIPDAPTNYGGGVAGTTIAAGDIAYIIVLTDVSGIIEWKCSVANSTEIIVKSFVPLSGGEPAPPVEEGELPDGTQGQIVVKGASVWESKNIDNSSIEIHPTIGLRVKADGIKNDQVGLISGPGLVYGQTFSGLSGIRVPAGHIPEANLISGTPAGGGKFGNPVIVYFANPPTVLTSLDLSAAHYALNYRNLVILHVYNPSTTSNDFMFAYPDDTDPTWQTGVTNYGGGVASMTLTADTWGYVMVYTLNERVNWRARTSEPCVVYVKGFVPVTA